MPNRSLLLGATLLGLLLLFVVQPAQAQTADRDRQAREIAAELRCPVCENLSVADSPSQLASEMRSVIRQKLESGETRDAILGYFVERYGEGILLDPPQRGFSLLIWLGALGAVFLGAFILVVRVQGGLRRREQAIGVDEPALAPGEQAYYDSLLDAALARYTGGEPEC